MTKNLVPSILKQLRVGGTPLIGRRLALQPGRPGDSQTQQPETPLLALIGMFVLSLSIGCDEQRLPSNLPQRLTASAEVASLTAPVIRAPHDLRIPKEYIVVLRMELSGQ